MTFATSTAAPHFTYRLDSWVDNAKPQAVSGADRPFCAMISAYAARAFGHPLGGAARMMSEEGIDKALVTWLDAHQVPEHRMMHWLMGLCHQPLTPWAVPECIGPFTLDPYQVETVNQTQVAGGVLALGCGLGKSITTVALALRARDRISTASSRCWIVCPLNAVPTWKRIQPLLAAKFHYVNIISMDSLHKVADAVLPTGGVIIFDEAHLLGEMSARRTKAAHTVRQKFDAGFCLTGTMLHGGIEKALSIQDLAIPGLARFSSRWTAGEYFRCLVKVKIGNRTVTELKNPVGLCREAFMKYLAWGSVNMTKDSAIVRQTVNIPHQELHTIEIGSCDRPIDEVAAECALKILDETGELPHAQAVAHAVCQMGLEEKISWVMSNMDDPSEAVVIFAHYTESLDLMAAALVDAGISFVRVDGTTSGKDRVECERRFQAGEVRVFLGQQVAASVSMNLQRASVSIILDHCWRASDYDQALARTCRRGQVAECVHFDLIANQFQRVVVNRVRAATNFNSEAAEFQDIRLAAARLAHTPAG